MGWNRNSPHRVSLQAECPTSVRCRKLLDTLFLIAAKWPPEYGGPGIYYKRHLRHVARIARHVRIVAWTRGGAIDLSEAPANVTAVPVSTPRGRFSAHIAGIRMAFRLLREVRKVEGRAGILFTGGSVSIGWRPTAVCMRYAGVPVLVENVLFRADDGESLRRARWPGLTSWSAGCLRAFCPVSLGLLASVRKAFPHATSVHLPYGVDLAENAPVEPARRATARAAINAEHATFVATSFGAIHSRKGQLPLVDAWLRWVRRSGCIGARLFIVGPPSDTAYLAAIHSLLQESSDAVANTVVFTGFCADVRPFLRAADVYMSAAFAEGLPISIVEALAHGVPVVCRKLEGVTNDFLRGHAVTAVEDWEADAVGSSLDILRDATARAVASHDARAAAEERFDIEKRMSIIRQLLMLDDPLPTSAA